MLCVTRDADGWIERTNRSDEEVECGTKRARGQSGSMVVRERKRCVGGVVAFAVAN